MTASNDMPPPWLSIVGIGEDGLDGLSMAARQLLAGADLIVGGRRHLALVASLGRPALETTVVPTPSTFTWAAARLRWRLEDAVTFGLHARPTELLRPHLRNGARLLVLVRDGIAPGEIANYLNAIGFGGSQLTVLEALGGPNERIRSGAAAGFAVSDIKSPVMLAIEAI